MKFVNKIVGTTLLSILLFNTVADAETNYQTAFRTESVTIYNYKQEEVEYKLEEDRPAISEMFFNIASPSAITEETKVKKEIEKDSSVFDIWGDDGRLFTAKKVKEDVWTKTNLNLRKIPNIESKVIKVIPQNVKLKRVGISKSGWSVIKYNKKLYFMASEYLTNKKPVIKKESVYHEKGKKGSYLGTYQLTAYCGCYSCSEGYSTNTASGTRCTEGRTIAMNGIKFGTKVYIEGYGVYTVEDRGGALGHSVIDIYFGSHSRTEHFGRKHGVKVYLVK